MDAGPDTAALSWGYDAAGNIRSLTQRYRPMDPGGLSVLQTADQSYWYAYDSMNRVVVSQGTLTGSGATAAIVRGQGVEVTYDAAGQRMSATTGTGVTQPGNAAGGAAGTGAHRELYGYSADGYLTGVDAAEAGADGVFGPASQLARYTRDLLGRTVAEDDYDAAGVARSRHGIVYDNRDQVLAETDTQRQGSDTYTSNTSNWYAASGVLVSSATQSWKSGSSTTSNDTTTYSYIWRDGPLTSQVTLTNTDGTTSSLYAYDNAGRTTSVTLTGGQRPRTVSLVTDLAGEILQRDEASAVSPNPHERRYVFDGVVMGTVSNDGSDDQTFAATLAEGTAARPATPGPFRSGASYGSAYANFDRQHDAINPTSAVSSGQSYTVRAGDTLASIAQGVWGDANLWYMLASANGLGADAALTAGRTLSIPGKVVNRGNTSDTFRPYDPTAALGDVQPNTPTPKPQGKKKNKCGIFGAILLAVVAIAVTVVTAGATAGLGSVVSGVISGAAGATASQAVGVATGIQDKFSFKGVALAALSGGVGGGIASVAGNGAIAGSQVLGGIVRGVAGSAITQGIAVATGLQKRFDWVGVAAAGVSGGVIAGVGGAIGYVPGSASAANIGRGVVAGFAGDLANAATRSLLEGSDFGDNVLAGLPDVIAQTVGTVITGALARSRQSAAEKALLEQAQKSANTPIGGTDQAATGSAVTLTPEARIALAEANGEISAAQAASLRARVVAERSQLTEGYRDAYAAASGSSGAVTTPRYDANGLPYLQVTENGYQIDLGILNLQESQYDATYSSGKFSNDPLAQTRNQQVKAAFQNNRDLIVQWNAVADREINKFLFASVGAPIAIAGGLASGGLLLAGGAGYFGTAGALVSIDYAQANARGYFNGFQQQGTLGGSAISLATGGRYGEGTYALGTLALGGVAAGRSVISRLPTGIAAETTAIGEGGAAARQTLYHYTNEAGVNGITESNSLNPSLWRVGTKDVRYGNGQYVSDIVPGTRTPSELSRDFLGQPFQGSRFTHYVEIDATGLGAVQGRAGVYVIPNEAPLDLTGRLLSSGKVPGR